MKDFDAIRVQRETAERSFKIGGETFTFRPYISADDVVALQDATNDAEFLKLADHILVERFFDPGQGDKWLKVRKDAERPLALPEIVAIVNYVQEITSGRPTEPSPDSSPSSGTNGTSSTVLSRSEESNSVV